MGVGVVFVSMIMHTLQLGKYVGFNIVSNLADGLFNGKNGKD